MDAIGVIFKTILGAILISCAFGSLCIWMHWVPAMQPYKSPVALNGVTTGPASTKRGDMYMPELQMVDSSRPVGYSYEVRDVEQSQKQIDFPMTGQ